MRKMTKIIISVIAISSVIFLKNITNERIYTSFADLVSIDVEEYNDRPSFMVEIESSEAQELKKIFNGKITRYETPSCPCGGVNIIFKNENKELVLYPAGDGCPTVRYGEYPNEKYFNLSENENERVRKILIKYGVTYPFGI